MNMNTRNIFRTLVVSTNLGYVLSALLLIYLDVGQFNAAYAALPEAVDSDNPIQNAIYSEYSIAALIVFWLISVVGLLLFKTWGRTLTVLGTIISLPCLALFGPTIEFGWESALNELLAICTGIIIASMYLNPISKEFNKALQPAPSALDSL